MNTAFYSVDPAWRKISAKMESLTRDVIAVYLGLLDVVGTVFLVFAGVAMVIGSVVLSVQDFRQLGFSVVMFPLGTAWIVSRSFRRTTWIYLGFLVLWMFVVTAAITPFLGESPKAPIALQIILAGLYFFPPAVATAVVRRRLGKV